MKSVVNVLTNDKVEKSTRNTKDEIFNIMECADLVLETIGIDPFGMNNFILESSITDIKPKDLTNPESVKKLSSEIRKIKNITTALKVWQLISGLVAVGGIAGSASTINANANRAVADIVTSPNSATSAGVITNTMSNTMVGVGIMTGISLLGVISTVACDLIEQKIKSSHNADLTYASKSLQSIINKLNRKYNDATDKKVKANIEREIEKAESLKAKIDSSINT